MLMHYGTTCLKLPTKSNTKNEIITISPNLRVSANIGDAHINIFLWQRYLYMVSCVRWIYLWLKDVRFFQIWAKLKVIVWCANSEIGTFSLHILLYEMEKIIGVKWKSSYEILFITFPINDLSSILCASLTFYELKLCNF